jgi:hypothetical protein
MQRIGLLLALMLAAGIVGACADHGGSGSPPTATAKASGPPLWGTVVGTVHDGSGRAVGGVLIVPAAADASVTDIPEIAVTTDQEGHYEWRLRPGRYTLTARLAGRSSAPVPVTVEAATRAAADLILPT